MHYAGRLAPEEIGKTSSSQGRKGYKLMRRRGRVALQRRVQLAIDAGFSPSRSQIVFDMTRFPPLA